MRILVAELKQETATFNPTPTRYEDFAVARGPDVLTNYRDTRTELAGAIGVFERENCECVPTLAAHAVSGGPIVAADLNRLVDELLEAIAENSNVDAAYLCFHGAMAGESEGDPEGATLARIRDVLGDLPIVVSLDLHAVVSDRLVELADVLVPYHTYPHTDHFETGQRAARVLLELLSGTIRPTVARVQLPMLVRGDELLTATGKFGEAIQDCIDFEATESGIAAGVMIGNAFTDVPDLQSNVIVTTNNDPALARQTAAKIGRFMWEHRQLFQAKLTSLEEAIAQANATDGMVVFSDAADATASGAAGDSNAILRGLVDAAYSKRALLAIVDAQAVEVAFESGVGANVTVNLGGTRDPTRFQPAPFQAHVQSLQHGEFTYEDGTTGSAGRVAVLTVGSIHVLVTERSVYVVGQNVYRQHGLIPGDFDLVVVKSPNGFRTWYEAQATLIVAVDVPGSTSANLKSLPFRHCVRPIFPLDDEVPSPSF